MENRIYYKKEIPKNTWVYVFMPDYSLRLVLRGNGPFYYDRDGELFDEDIIGWVDLNDVFAGKDF